MKKKIICVLAIMILIMACTFSSVFATEADIMPISEEGLTAGDMARDIGTSGVLSMNNISETIDKDVFECAEIIEKKEQLINGNTYLCGNTVSIESETIEGDLFICANTLKIDENVTVNGNAYICASNVVIDGYIARGVYIVAKDITFGNHAIIDYDVYAAAEHIKLGGTFRRDFNTSVANLEIEMSGLVEGSLNYASDKEATIADGSKIANINFSKYVEEKETLIETICRYVLDFAKYFVLAMVILIILMKVSLNFVNGTKKCLGISSFGAGILMLILMPIIIVLLFMLRVTSTVAIVALIALLAILILSMAITNIAIGAAISEKYSKIKLPIATALSTVISWILLQIPVIGAVISFIMLATGMGIVSKYWFVKTK